MDVSGLNASRAADFQLLAIPRRRLYYSELLTSSVSCLRDPYTKDIESVSVDLEGDGIETNKLLVL